MNRNNIAATDRLNEAVQCQVKTMLYLVEQDDWTLRWIMLDSSSTGPHRFVKF